jgi:hypothetical protein
MSPQLQDEIGQAHQRLSRMAGARVGLTLAVVSTGFAAIAVVTNTGAHANPRPARAIVHVSPRRLAGEIRAFQARGYVAYQCTIAGTSMRDSRGNLVSIEW